MSEISGAQVRVWPLEVMLVGGLSMLIEVMPETCFPCSSKNFIVEALHDSSTGFVKPFEFVYCSPAVS